jgi:hypothetical protein
MTKKKYYYKAVSNNMKSMNSVIFYRDRLHPFLILKYLKRRWVYPKIKGTKLFVFGQKKDLIEFYKGTSLVSSWYRIFKCEVKNPDRDSISVYVSETFYGRTLPELKKIFKNLIKYCINKTPKRYGAYGVDAVKLIKEVKK